MSKKAAKKNTKKPTKKAPKAPAARKSGPSKGISRSPSAVFRRGVRDLGGIAQKFERMAARADATEPKEAKKIRAAASQLNKLVTKYS